MTTLLTIFRQEEAIEVSVEILQTYKGTEAIDDPSEYLEDDYGYTKSGECITLTPSEQEQALRNVFAI